MMHYNFISAVFITLFVLLASPSTSTPTTAYSPRSDVEHRQARCTNAHPLLTLHDITFSSSIIYSTPAHLAVAEGTVSFNLSNSAVPYKTHCSASSSQIYSFFYGNFVYNCDPPVGNGVKPGASAVFTFSEPDGTFAVNQTYGCDDKKFHKK